MKKFYRNLFQVYLFMARALFPKDSALQREFLLIKVSAIEKEKPEVFEKLGGCTSAPLPVGPRDEKIGRAYQRKRLVLCYADVKDNAVHATGSQIGRQSQLQQSGICFG